MKISRPFGEKWWNGSIFVKTSSTDSNSSKKCLFLTTMPSGNRHPHPQKPQRCSNLSLVTHIYICILLHHTFWQDDSHWFTMRAKQHETTPSHSSFRRIFERAFCGTWKVEIQEKVPCFVLRSLCISYLMARKRIAYERAIHHPCPWIRPS